MKHTGLDNINKPAFDASMKEIRAAIKKDKEIISQIKVIEGESENSYVFPKGVVPLKMYLTIERDSVVLDQYVYFDYTYPACLVDGGGSEFQEPHTLSFIEGCVVISGQFEITQMSELVYINANEVDTVEDTLNFNSFVVLNPINVVANPTLAGTENQLTGLQVDGTKFKVSGGTKLYKHTLGGNITMVLGNNYEIISTDNTVINDMTKFLNVLNKRVGFPFIDALEPKPIIISIFNDGINQKYVFYGITQSTVTNPPTIEKIGELPYQAFSVSDTVTEL